jgi:hypothetical protein
MITCKELGNYGRLGNQLFQIASTIGIAKKNDMDYGFPEWEYQKHFDEKLPLVNRKLFLRTYQEVNTYYQDVMLSHGTDWNLVGHFQSWKYFHDYREIILKYFTPNFETNDYCIDKISIHVRRGDYTALSHIHPNLGIEYYKKAMDEFPNDQFIVFSDDLPFVTTCGWFEGDRFIFKAEETPELLGFVNAPMDLLHLIYMSKCKAHIIANSSFSWWAAYLSGNKTICPSRWVEFEERNDRIVPGWIAL